MRLLITGSRGFIGRNLRARLESDQRHELSFFDRGGDSAALHAGIDSCDAVIHLAGANRPPDEREFQSVNADLTAAIAERVRLCGRRVPIVFASSTQAELDNPYGRSKLAGEAALGRLRDGGDCPVYIFRLPGVFGKWCRPNYNSVVATFCHNFANSLPVVVHDSERVLRLVYVDHVVDAFVALADAGFPAGATAEVAAVRTITLGALAEQIRSFRNCRRDLGIERVGTGLVRELYSTYMSYVPPSDFSYPLVRHGDARGVFVEMLKTKDSGQFSFFTAGPGVTRGGHWHHTKTEKFLVVKGRARFRFRNMDTGETHELCTAHDAPAVVDTVPGWAHDITNIGDDEMIVMLWANEVFDRSRPDTYAKALS